MIFFRNTNRDQQGPPTRRSFSRCTKTLRDGSLLLEAMVAIAIFSIFLSGIGLALVLGERSTVTGGDYARAAFYAEEQLEALRHMQENDFSSLTSGTFGIAVSGNAWAFSGSSITENGFTRSVTITEQTEDWFEATSEVVWNFGTARSGSILMTTYLTNWREASVVGNWANVSLAGSLTESGSPEFQKVVVNNQFAYVVSAGGAGLYIYDLSSPLAPTRVASSFSLGAGAYDVVAIGDRLFIATDNPTQEVVILNISNPAALTTNDIVDEYDLTGSLTARSLRVYTDTVFVGVEDDTTHDQFYALETNEAAGMTLLSSLAVSGSVLAMSLSEGYAYIASDRNSGELLVIDIIEPENVQYAPGVGIDMNDSFDGISMLASGTSALIGRQNGGTIDELTLYEVGLSPVPSPPPGPWALEIGGSVHALETIEGTQYIFVGNAADGTELRVLDLHTMAQGGSPTLDTVDVGADIMGLDYDWLHDLLYAVSSDQLIIFQSS